MTAHGPDGPRALTSTELHAAVKSLAAAVSRDYPAGVVLVGVLKGSVFLLADIARMLEVPCELDFLALSPYGSGGDRVALSKDLSLDVTGRDVLVVVDIVDRGLTAAYLMRLLAERKARTVAVLSLFDRPSKRIVPVDLAYVGFESGEEYLIGYGLDAGERGRNLKGVVALDPAALRAGGAASLRRLFEG